MLDDRAQHICSELLQLGRTGERPHQVRERLPLRLLPADTPRERAGDLPLHDFPLPGELPAFGQPDSANARAIIAALEAATRACLSGEGHVGPGTSWRRSSPYGMGCRTTTGASPFSRRTLLR